MQQGFSSHFDCNNINKYRPNHNTPINNSSNYSLSEQNARQVTANVFKLNNRFSI